MNEDQARTIISIYKEQVKNTREALRLAGVPESLVVYYTMNIPEIDKMIPEDVMKFYEEIKIMIVLYLSRFGFSDREIGRRIGGHTYNMVHRIIENNKAKNVTNSPK